jgi:hypothetical protein
MEVQHCDYASHADQVSVAVGLRRVEHSSHNIGLSRTRPNQHVPQLPDARLGTTVGSRMQSVFIHFA